MVESFFAKVAVHVMRSEIQRIKASVARGKAEAITISKHDVCFGGNISTNEPLR